MASLFSDFEPVSSEQWKERIKKDLKGEAYESLVWKNENGFDIEPFYHGDRVTTNYEPAFSHSDWDLCVEPESADPPLINKFLLQRLSEGASSILLSNFPDDPELAFKNVGLEHIRSSFFLGEQEINGFFSYVIKRYGKQKLQCAVFPKNITSVKTLRSWLNALKPYAGNFDVLGCDLLPVHNLGACAVTEVSWALVLLDVIGPALKNDFPGVRAGVRMGVSTDFFVEIAKLRSLRRLYALLSATWHVEGPLHILAETSLTSKSVSDSYNNLLRTTVEAMAASAGGCNELLVRRFDALQKEETGFAGRMALNQQLILKHESYFDRVADVACGSYYIESITDLIAEKALAEAKEQDAEVFFEDLQNGKMATMLEQEYKRKEEQVFNGSRTVIGVNKFRNEKEQLSPDENRLKRFTGQGLRNAVLKYEIEKFFSLSHGLKGS